MYFCPFFVPRYLLKAYTHRDHRDHRDLFTRVSLSGTHCHFPGHFLGGSPTSVHFPFPLPPCSLPPSSSMTGGGFWDTFCCFNKNSVNKNRYPTRPWLYTNYTVPKFQLRLLDPEPDAHHLINLPIFFSRQSVVRVGRIPDNNDVVLDCKRVPLLISRHHVDFVWNESKSQVEVRSSPASTNGTYLNNVLLPPDKPHVLRPGDTVSFGGPTFVTHNGVRMPNPFRYQVIESEHDYIRMDIRSPYVDSNARTAPPYVVKGTVVLPYF